MGVTDELAKLTGEWSGRNRLWLSPNEPARESDTAAFVAPIGNGKFLSIRYVWAEDGPQEGLIVLGIQPAGDRATAAWVDSWHMGHSIMSCAGEVLREGAVSVKGTYPAPPGPDWGWRIVIAPRGRDAFRLNMFNVTPEGEEHLAVEADYSRKG